jgi:hypothetical protein
MVALMSLPAPIYANLRESEVDRSQLDRVKNILQRMNPGDSARSQEWVVPFRPEPCLSESDVQAWEMARNAFLPAEYRTFLLEIGNGGLIADSNYADFIVWPLGKRTNAFRPGVFPVTRRELDHQMERLREGREVRWKPFSELSMHRKNGWPLPGCLHLGVYPGGDEMFLVVNGELRGTIWVALDSGYPETNPKTWEPFNFLTWFEDVLFESKSW